MSTIDTTPDLPVTVYSPESPLKNPANLMHRICWDLWRCRELVWILFTRDLKAQYRQSYFGYIWLFVPVLSTMIVWMFLNSSEVIQVAETPIPYPAYVLIGTIIWTAFTSALNQPLASFQAGQGVFMKLNVPPEVFIFSGLGRLVFDLFIRTLVLIPTFLILGIEPASTCWLFPFGLAAAMLCGAAIGFIILPLGSLYSDVSRVVSIAMGFAMYLTPIVYPPPETGWAATLIRWNPLTSIVVSTRDWLTLGWGHNNMATLTVAGVSLLTLAFAMLFLRAVQPRLVERMGM